MRIVEHIEGTGDTWASPTSEPSKGLLSSEQQRVTGSISSALSKVHEKMSAPGPAAARKEGEEGELRMTASGSWFRRLWNGDDGSVVTIPPPREEQSSTFSSIVPPEPAPLSSTESPQQHDQDAQHLPTATVGEATQLNIISATSGPWTEVAEMELAPSTQPHAEIESPTATTATGDLAHTGEVSLMDAPTTTPERAAAQNDSGDSTSPDFHKGLDRPSNAEKPAAARVRPPRPLSFSQLQQRFPAGESPRLQLQDRPAAPSSAQPAPTPESHDIRETSQEASSRPIEPIAPVSPPASISAARRAAGNPTNPFDRPSLYRPPALTDDQSFNEAFTTPPDATAPPSGRWDPIPTLRPSGWRDSGSFRAASADPSQDEPWEWTSAKKEASPATPAGWTDPVPAPADDSEPILTRQWGLLSRFQQSRGLGLANRRSNPADDSGTHDAENPVQNRRKG